MLAGCSKKSRREGIKTARASTIRAMVDNRLRTKIATPLKQESCDSNKMAPRIVHSAKSFVLWDKFQVYQGFNWQTPVFHIGVPPVIKQANSPKTYPNPIKIALQYKGMIDSGQAKNQADLARILGVSRAKATQMLNLLKLSNTIFFSRPKSRDPCPRHYQRG
jgi:hypothetical protein